MIREKNEPKKDCFAYKNSTTCNALTEMFCAKEKCAFYMSQNNYLEKQLELSKGGK